MAEYKARGLLSDLPQGAAFGTGSPAEEASRPLGPMDIMASAIGKLLFNAATLPGDVYQGKTQMYGEDGRTSPEVIDRANALASLLTMGAGAVPAEVNSLRAGIRPYQNTIDALMGFKRNGPQKGFSETAYPYVQNVEVTLPATRYSPRDTFIDQIRGLNADHATERAYRNWPSAMHITPIFPKK